MAEQRATEGTEGGGAIRVRDPRTPATTASPGGQWSAGDTVFAARDRLLESTVTAATVLLSEDDLRTGLNTALKVIGECLGADRVCVCEHIADGGSLHRILFEWDAPGVESQMEHPRHAQFDYEGVEGAFEALRRGQVFSGEIEQLADPFRTAQSELGVKSGYAVPVMVDGAYWGVIGFDDCREVTTRGDDELSLLKTTAACIGNAIRRDRLRAAREQAERALSSERDRRADELAHANDSLKRTLDALATNPRADAFLARVVAALSELLGGCPTSLWSYDLQARTASLVLLFDGENVSNGAEARHPNAGRPMPLDFDLPTIRKLLTGRRPVVTPVQAEESLSEEQRRHLAASGVKSLLAVPLVLGDAVRGVLSARLANGAELRVEQLELAQALAHQATLALELSRLGDEAKEAAVLKERESAAQRRATELEAAGEALRDEVRERQRAEQISRGQTQALVETLNAMAEEPALDNLLGYVLRSVAEQLGDNSGGLWLYDPDTDSSYFHLVYDGGRVRGAADAPPEWVTPRGGGEWDAEYLPELKRQKVLFHGEHELYCSAGWSRYRDELRGMGIRAMLIVPLFFGGQFLGYIGSHSSRRREYRPEEVELARALAHHATLAIQLTRLAAGARQSAVLEERNRLAREIHDTLAQAFTGLIIQLEAGRRVLDESPEEAGPHVARAVALAREGLAEARRSVQALRARALERADLAEALRNVVAGMTTGAGVEAGTFIRGAPRELPAEVGANLLRIGQEALTNALRHAEAGRITVELTYEEAGGVSLRVADDGRGFDPASGLGDGFGLSGMHERAGRIGGRLEVSAARGAGTQVVVTVPAEALAGRKY